MNDVLIKHIADSLIPFYEECRESTPENTITLAAIPWASHRNIPHPEVNQKLFNELSEYLLTKRNIGIAFTTEPIASSDINIILVEGALPFSEFKLGFQDLLKVIVYVKNKNEQLSLEMTNSVLKRVSSI